MCDVAGARRLKDPDGFAVLITSSCQCRRHNQLYLTRSPRSSICVRCGYNYALPLSSVRADLEFPLSTGGTASVPWTFVQDSSIQPDYPEYVCPAAIVHGLQDEIVPVQSTRALVEGR